MANFFPSNLRFLRKNAKLKQDEMLDRVGFKQTTWGGYETGKSQPYLDGIIRISEFFGISESDLLHKDLSKNVELIRKNPYGKKRKNVEGNVELSVELNPKKYDFNTSQTLASEPDIPDIIQQRMPQVITLDSEGNENVILVPVRARAGYLSGYSDPEFMSKLPAYRLPGLNTGTFRLFEVDGQSMYPTLNGGDMVIGSFVEQLRDIRDDRVYVVATKNDGVVVKRCLNRIQKDGKLILKSDNYKDRDMYPPIVADPQEIIEVWYATGFISRQMRPPAEMYNRLIDLEGRLTLLEDVIKKSPPKR